MTSTLKLYDKFKLPLHIEVGKTTFSHPENFVKRTSRKGEPTTIEDGEGSWMNAGAGGESNTIDLSLVLKDSEGKIVQVCDIIPVQVKLWCTENGLVVDSVKDEVSQKTEQDRSGHRRGATNALMVSGKASSSLHINHDGRGMVSCRITTTSQLNERKRFTIEVTPDFAAGTSTVDLDRIFKRRGCKPGDTTLTNPSLSMPLEVMSKINRLGKVRGCADSFRQVLVYLEKSITALKGAHHNHTSKEYVPELLSMIKHIENILTGTNGTSDIQARELPKVLAYRQARDYEKLSGCVFRFNLSEVKKVEELLNTYIDDAAIIEKLPENKNISHRPW